ncbi:Thyrotropin-releasing hormone-degrading ectoenzyme, partial [Orchesella cincta]
PIGDEHEESFMVYIEFVSRIADDRLNGLYLDYYVEPTSQEKRFLSTTLFAPNHARKAFPCFDSPGFKATFDISIGRKVSSNFTSISNMPISHSVPIPELTGWVFDVFKQTPPLPTYIVALITTDFSFRSIKSGEFEFRLYAPAHLLQRTKQLNTTVRERNKAQNPYLLQDPLLFIADMLESFQFLTGLGSYPMPKLDVIALPHFFFNAMENMGAITFKYPVILNVEGTTTTSELLRLNYVAGHEITHQWFGNMLTPKSWTYVWLKESFSDFLGALYLSQKSGINFDEIFANQELQKAMRFDAGANTHPLENHIKSAATVADIYTDIPYRKGASIIYMISNFLSKEVFHQGLQSLFDAKKFSNIDQYDLFEILEQKQKENSILASQGLPNVTVKDILNSWTQKSGYPIVRVRRDGSNLVLTQEKFKNGLLIELQTRDVNDTESKNDVDSEELFWWIPITIADGMGKNSVHWLHPNSGETIINNTVQGKFHSIKRVPLGYFRVLYSNDNLQRILKNLKHFYTKEELGAYYHPEISTERDSSFLKPVERSQIRRSADE